MPPHPEGPWSILSLSPRDIVESVLDCLCTMNICVLSWPLLRSLGAGYAEMYLTAAPCYNILEKCHADVNAGGLAVVTVI